MGRGAAVVLITVAVALSGFALEGTPLTEVIYGSTGYTLPAGALELAGYLSLPGILPSISLSLGSAMPCSWAPGSARTCGASPIWAQSWASARSGRWPSPCRFHSPTPWPKVRSTSGLAWP